MSEKDTAKKKKERVKPKYGILKCLGYIFSTAFKYRREVPVLLVFQILFNVSSAIFGFYMSPMILSKLEAHSTAGELLITAAFFIGGCFISDAAIAYIGNGMGASGLKMTYQVELRSYVLEELNDKLSNTSYCHCLDNKFARTGNRAYSACGGNSGSVEGMWNTLQNLAVSFVMLIFFTAMLTYVNPIVFAVTVVISVVDFVISSYIYKYNYRHREELSHIDRPAYYLTGLPSQLSAAKDIRLFGLKSWINRLTDKAFAAKQAYSVREHRFYLIGTVSSLVLEFLRSGAIIFILLKMSIENGMSAAEFMLYFSAVNSFNGQFNGLLNNFLDMKNKCLDISCILEFLNYNEPYNFGEGAPIPKEHTYEITLEKVSYTYPESDKKIIDDLSLTIKPGEKVAIVGLNGAGKTTLIRLMTGLLDPDEGRVLLNGTDIRKFNRSEYYRLFSTVFQDFNIFDVTVAETVAQSATDIDLERVKDCIEKAGLTKAVSELPHGLNTHLGREVYLDGVVLSGGQTQRLMLARALYKNGAVLVLDEPTAALDPLAESNMYKKYNEMSAGKTSVFISHRLASTRFCDRVLYLKDGKIAEEGTHDSLLALGKEYARLFEIQSRYYQEDYSQDKEAV